MKDATEKELQEERPAVDLEDALKHCLSALYKDDEHMFQDYIVKGLSFEELIGTLLMAQEMEQEYYSGEDECPQYTEDDPS